ncbi:hypothetical protein FQN57_005272 [Myotisia sp. PD_48]|nr:hypothetical protein FQN57_005272 [Myotisia sp. PD_48]
MASPSPSSQVVAKRRSDTQLMPPPPPCKRIKRPPKTLEEDDYDEALSHIIARDFFPGLQEAQAQQDFLAALESNDKTWRTTAGRRMEQLMTPGPRRKYYGTDLRSRDRMDRSGSTPRSLETPRGWKGDTPASNGLSTPSSVVTSSTTAFNDAKARELSNIKEMGLGSFQAKYTSEDNESFNKMLDKQNIKKREKYAWLWNGNKIPSSRELVHKKKEAKWLENQEAPEGSREKQLMKAGEGSQNDTGGNEIRDPSGALAADQRPARPDGWKSKPENALMFIPSSVEDELETVQQTAESMSRMGQKQLLHHNTRFIPLDENIPPPSPSLSAVKDAIAGRPRPTDSEPGYTGGETPRVNGYAFVDEDEPSQHDSDDSEVDYHLRLLTSQAVDSTPNPFKLGETRKRESLLHRMVDRVAKNKRREKVTNETKTPVPLFPNSPMIAFGRTPGGLQNSSKTSMGKAKAANLTPAAQRLWAQVGSTPKREGISSGSTRNMWTPTPKRAR